MRKLSAILLTLILLFNVLGFYGIFEGLNYQNKKSIIQRLNDQRYDESQAITLKVPITIPYAANSTGYQRVDGDFEYKGEFYHLVKQRYENDTLYVVCIKDAHSKKIHQALNDYVKTFTDKPIDTQSSGKILNTFLKDFLFTSFEIKHLSDGWSFNTVQNPVVVVFIDSFAASIIHPPERA